MPIRFLLKFATPFRVGDEVFLAYPPNKKAVGGGVREIRPLKATISSIKVSFGLTEELTIREPVDSYEVKVEHVTYTLIPFPPYQFSPFTVCCSATDTKPVLFTTEVEFMDQEAIQL